MSGELTNVDYNTNTEIYDLMSSIGKPNAWASLNQQQQNFTRLVAIERLSRVPIKDSCALDFGCGTGDLAPFLRRMGATDYLGVDIYPPSIDLARKQYPGERFEVRDLLAAPLTERFTYAFCSGSLSTRVSFGNYEFMAQVLERLLACTEVGVSFNFLTDSEPDQLDELFFYSIPRVDKICRQIATGGKVDIQSVPSKHQAQGYLYR